MSRCYWVNCIAVLMGVSACVDNTAHFGKNIDGTPTLGDDGPWGIAVVGTDYLSSSVSVLDRMERELFFEGVVDSGSSPPGLSTALSGDVALPRAFNSNNWLVLLDRYPNSVLTLLDPHDFAVSVQLSVATGFAANPHDFVWVGQRKAYVTRYETNPSPGREPFDAGDDVLIVDPLAGRITGRISMATYVDATPHSLQARPDQMTVAKGIVWITLNHLDAGFHNGGQGLVIGVDPATDEVRQVVAIPEVRNCSGIVYVARRDALYVSCSGLFAAGLDEQLRQSALVAIDLGSQSPSATIFAYGTEGVARPFGFELDVARERWLLVVRYGDMAADIPDRLVAIDIITGTETIVHLATSISGLGGLLADDATDSVYVGDAAALAPRVHLYEVADGQFGFLSVIDAHPRVGLPPRHIRFY
ncbi:MAG: hypothetical protein A2341_17215 [Deltaproteobacteria bacterium RIFOXYB12_FULL_58_9]|nr:MAG: hypothetical protein A2341_17215 [Deltaproteobacteria bacterium RIFOXYB12_FULL_58_9]